VSPPFEVAGGTIAVSEEPGLGLTLDRDALSKWEEVEPPELPRALVRISYRGMSSIYGRLPVKSLRDRSGVAPLTWAHSAAATISQLTWIFGATMGRRSLLACGTSRRPAWQA